MKVRSSEICFHFILHPSAFILPLHGACWTTMRTRSLPTCISSGLPSCMGMVLPLTLISSGGTLAGAFAPAVLEAAAVLAPDGGAGAADFSPVSAGRGQKRRRKKFGSHLLPSVC